MFRSLTGTLVVAAALSLTSCSAEPPLTQFPSGHAIPLLDGPIHLGDDFAGGQSFAHGAAVAARVCSLVNMPSAARAYVEVRNVRNTESLGDLLTVNGKPYRLPMTLERDLNNLTSNATSASPVELVGLGAGPSEICLVAGLRACGDLDDFEVDQVVLYVQGIDPDEVAVRRNLTLGQPPPSEPPSRPWGRDQRAYGASFYYRGCAIE